MWCVYTCVYRSTYMYTHVHRGPEITLVPRVLPTLSFKMSLTGMEHVNWARLAHEPLRCACFPGVTQAMCHHAQLSFTRALGLKNQVPVPTFEEVLTGNEAG